MYIVIITWTNRYAICKQNVKIATTIKEAYKLILKRRNNPNTLAMYWAIHKITIGKEISSGRSV